MSAQIGGTSTRSDAKPVGPPLPEGPVRVAALSASNLAVGHGRTVVAEGIHLQLEPGSFTSIVGPNGCGKSTLLRALGGISPPLAGSVLVGGDDLAGVQPRELASRLAFLPQNPIVPAGVSVRELVGYGRHPHQPLIGGDRKGDRDAVDDALLATGMSSFAERDVAHLSGGERQRAWVAMALAQQTQILLLDEPTTYLDIRFQLDVLRLLRSLVDDRGLAVAVVLHDLNQASAFSDHMMLLANGAVVTSGTPAEVLTVPNVASAFGVDVTITPDPESGLPLCRFPGRATPGTPPRQEACP